MKIKFTHLRGSSAFTLLEMTMVIAVLLALIGMGFYGMTGYSDWKLGRTASETLREAYTAQRLYLSDNPTVAVASITAANVLPYMPNTPAVMPTIKSLANTQLAIRVNISPPVVNAGGGVTYDPSGSPTDSLWDVGE